MAFAQANLGNQYLRMGRSEEAKPHPRHAHVVFAHRGSPHAHDVAQALVEACGSPEAASDYLAELFEVHEVD
jgi:hypothetical protein